MATLTPVDGDPFAGPRAGPNITIRPTGAGPRLTPVDHDPFAAAPPVAQVQERFGEFDQPAGGGQGLQNALNDRALDMTRGPALSPAAQMAIEAANVLPAATQGTNPHVSSYGGKLVSNETFEDDGGNVLYRDPQTGKVQPTDNSRQVAIRDPADGVVKIFERSPDTNESAAVGVSRVLSPGLAAGAPTARPAIAAAQNIIPKASDIAATAKPYYRAFTREADKIEVPAQTGSDLAGRMRGALDKANFIPELAAPVYSAINILDKGEPLTIAGLQNIKRVIGRSFNSPDKNVRDAASVASREIGKIISEVAPQAGQNLKTADAIHSTSRALQDLQRKEAVAGLRTGRSGYGGNAVNAMRQVLSPIVQRSIEGRITSFRPDEIAAMRDIVEGTTATNTLRTVGQFSPTRGLLAATGPVAGAAAGGLMASAPVVGAAAAIPAIGAASNKLAAVLTGRQIEHLKDLVARRSPEYAKAVARATERYDRTQLEFANKPTPAKFAAYLSASRALASGLQHDGVQVTSGNLLKMIAGQPPATADEQQPPVIGSGG